MDTQAILKAKQELRERVLALRASADPGDLARKSREIAGRIESLPCWRQAGFVCSYIASKPGEVETDSLIESAFVAGKRVCVPVIDPADKSLLLVEITSLQGFVPGPFGILEPALGNRVITSELAWDLAIVPGLAFDRQGNRIGFGKGYYDRLLATRDAVRIAPAFDFQISTWLPTLPHDLPVDLLVTESGVIDCRR